MPKPGILEVFFMNDFFYTSEANVEIFKENGHLLDDFYADSVVERTKISKISDGIVRARKR